MPKPTLQSLLNNELSPPLTSDAFLEYLKTKEHSEENYEFLQAAKEYRSKQSGEKLHFIVNEFIKPGAPKELNCTDKVRKKLLDDVLVKKDNDPRVLNDLEELILDLMRHSSLPQFLSYMKNK